LTRTPERPGRRPARHIAFLRAINVGKRLVKMDYLREIFEARGFVNVETFIQTGNVIFAAPPKTRKTAAAIEREIETHLARVLGYEVVTFLRSPDELRTVAGFAGRHAADLAAGASFYIGFLRSAPPGDAVARLTALSSAGDEFQVHGRELHWIRRRTGLADYAGPSIEKVLGVPMTVRNITTVARIAATYCLDAQVHP
jgi:uncharacterized protein (DUF1697 family)